ncbi:protection of telomeres protein 1 isoform X2 [Cyprinodon tularosa]|uniref:protection of telomeres protein 1 isoform X2 n=1 Tax=Cyprinodon tularosa TaxID=77115 RepID=UPI0018E260D2|nr:protection of telomeres protein 1 isoform X2 [Cyprinodon tularosa]
MSKDEFVMKAVIQEEEESTQSVRPQPSINLVILGALAENFNLRVNLGDVVLASGFTVGKSPTANKDKLHACNLLLSGDDASIYVSKQKPAEPKSPLARKRSSLIPAEGSRAAKGPKYSYVHLDQLKDKSVVNVYGVVTFFKQPFKTRGTDYCSTLKITDQSNQKVGCTIFCGNLEDHPKIFEIGDIVRMHRVKVGLYNNSPTLVNTSGFSVLTFSGTVGAAVEPRTRSKTFHFGKDDRRAVEELRSWAASHSPLPPSSTAVTLAAVQPNTYFDLTCQLLAKAPIESSCTLLRVWDGTRCPQTLLKVIVEPNVTEGPHSFSKKKEGVIANVLVYDNHVETSRQLQPGAFLRIYNLRAIPGSSKLPGLTNSQPVEVDPLAFHLHGGTSYGRGIRILPEDSPDVQELKRLMEAFSEEEEEPSDSELLEVFSTPPEYLDGDAVDHQTERTCTHQVQQEPLSQVKQNDQSQVHHVRVQLSSYQPHRLFQALKLFCSRCSSIRDIPDDEELALIFSEASKRSEAYSPPEWALSGELSLPGDASGSPSVHLSTELMNEGQQDQLIFLKGCSLEETCHLAATYKNIVPVRSSDGQLAPLDLSAPFLFRGRRRCKRCSKAALAEPSVEGKVSLDEKIIAEALGVQLLQPMLLMKLMLQDDSDTLDVFLWKHAELFFGVAAGDVWTNQEAQSSVQQAMDALCPAEGSRGRRPWLDLCLLAYRPEGDEENRTCYQICNTAVIKHPSE